jgi:hypothetical protein
MNHTNRASVTQPTTGHAIAESCVAGVPAYFYPWPASTWWQQLADVRPGTVVVVNPASGPGAAVDPRYTAVVEAAHARGLVLFGYVDSDYGAIGIDDVVAQSSLHQSWYEVDGIFVDRIAPDNSSLPHYAKLAQRLHAAGMSVTFNAGQPYVDRGYAEVADHVVLFEGPLSTYAECQFPQWTQDIASNRIWHLVYGVATAEEMQDVVAHATANNAGLLYVTDGIFPNPWDHLPAYWQHERQLLDRASPRSRHACRNDGGAQTR